MGWGGGDSPLPRKPPSGPQGGAPTGACGSIIWLYVLMYSMRNEYFSGMGSSNCGIGGNVRQTLKPALRAARERARVYSSPAPPAPSRKCHTRKLALHPSRWKRQSHRERCSEAEAWPPPFPPPPPALGEAPTWALPVPPVCGSAHETVGARTARRDGQEADPGESKGWGRENGIL